MTQTYLNKLSPHLNPFGTVIHGTMRTEDLVPTLLDTLKGIDRTAWRQFLDRIYSVDRELAYLICNNSELLDGHPVWNEEKFCWPDLINDLIDAISFSKDIEFGYFGPHVGDGSDLGFWPDFEALEEAVRWNDIVVISSESEMPSIPTDNEGPTFVVVETKLETALYRYDWLGWNDDDSLDERWVCKWKAPSLSLKSISDYWSKRFKS